MNPHFGPFPAFRGSASNFSACQLRLEHLEDRTVPAIIVTTASDDVSHTGLSLRDAIAQAGVSDTIVFNTAQMGTSTITLAQGQLELSGARTIMLDAGASPITISGDNTSRVFRVDAGVQASFNGLTVQGGKDNSGGGIFNTGVLTLNNVNLSGNSAVNLGYVPNGGGGGIYNSGTLAISNGIFSNNTALSNSGSSFGGGAIYNDANGTLTANNVTLSGNTAGNNQYTNGHGGGIFNLGTLTLDDTIVSGNSARTDGGGIYNSGYSVTYAGQEIYSPGTMTVSNATVAGNSASNGGGIYTWYSGMMMVANTTIAGNSAGRGGGIFHQAGTLTVTGCTLSGNSADASGGLAEGNGGGIFAYSGTATVINSTLYGNSAASGQYGYQYGNGGGIYGKATVINCTITGNSAQAFTNAFSNYIGGSGGGLYRVGIVRNTILAGNTATGGGPRVEFPPTDREQQVYAYTDLSAGGHNLIGGNPGLAALGNYGGPTQTMALLSASPAINAGGSIAALAVGMDATATTLTLVGGAVPVGTTLVPTPIEIGGEQMLVTGASGNNLTVIRGAGGTTATAHDGNTAVYLPFDQRGGFRPGFVDIGAFERGAVLPNHAPLLDTSGNPTLTATNEDRASASVAVATILRDSVTDPLDVKPLEGMAVIGLGGGGIWQYSLNGGRTFGNFGPVSESAARLLRAGDRIRFIPAKDFNGASSIAYHAWDRKMGRAGGVFDITATGTGGNTAFSVDQETAGITVNPVNDAPVLARGAPLLPAVQVNNANPAGITVGSLAGTFISDVDVGALKGIAIIAVSGTGNGQWQFSTNGGVGWTSFGTTASGFGVVSSGRAVLLDESDLLRFLPNSGYTLISSASVLPAITYRAWDQTSGNPGLPNRIVATGRTTAFSARSQVARVRVNDAPVLTPAAGTLGPTPSAKVFITTITALLGNSAQDFVVGTRQGIAVTGLTTTPGGRWQYSLNNGLTFVNFGEPAETVARLLRATDKIRYVPMNGSPGTATITFRAWDQTTSSAGKALDLTAAGIMNPRGAFSSATDTAGLSVT